jgi:hypothetical protein
MLKTIFSAKTKAVFLTLFLLSSCATASLEQMRKETKNFKLPKTPDDKSAIVYVVRPGNGGPLVRFNVFLDYQGDDSEMGYNRGEQYIYFKLTPGQHRIFSKAENWAEISIDAKVGETYFVEQTAGLGFIMARNSLKQVSEDQGKYLVKNSKLGTTYKTEK